jgi:hypothetical protein
MNRIWVFAFVLTLATCFGAPLTSTTREVEAQSNSTSKKIAAVKIDTPPTIDGKLNDTCWEKAAKVKDFINLERGAAPTDQTEAYMAYDAENLYAAFRCFDSKVENIRANQTRRDDDFKFDDRVDIYLDTYHDRRNAYHFALNPKGTQLDEKYGDLGWDGQWKAATSIKEDGWIAEMAIPFSIMRFSDKPLQTWGINLVRIQRWRDETQGWADTGVNFFLADKFGDLKELQFGKVVVEDKEKVTAYTAVRSFLEPEVDFGLQGGIDMAYRFSSNLSAFGTLNPDYSHVESEIQGIVLTDIEQRLTDRRPFFQEDGQIFSSPISLFYSRRIKEMRYGAKMIGKVRGSNFALMDVQAKSPSSNNLAIRTKSNIAKTSTLGLLYVGKEEEKEYNRAVGLDSRFPLPYDASLSIACAKSWTPFVKDNNFAFYTNIYRGGIPISFSATYRDIEANFNAENGYIPLKDDREASLWFLYSWKPVETPIQTLNLELVSNRHFSHAGELTRTGQFEMISFGLRSKFSFGIIRHDWSQGGFDNGHTAVQFVYNWQELDRTKIICNYGDYEGSKATFLTLSSNFILFSNFSVGIEGEDLRRKFPDGRKTYEFSTRTSLNYDLGKEKWITVRVRLESDNVRNVNAVLKYTFGRNWVGYVVYGDQEAKKTVNQIFIKISTSF